MTGLEKAALIFLVVLVGLDLFGRWTGRSFSLDLLHPNQIGGTINQALAKRGVGAPQ